MKRMTAIIPAALLALSLTACAGEPEYNVVEEQSQAAAELYLLDIYYSKTLGCYCIQASEDSESGEYVTLRLADDVISSFQQPDLVGAWNPTDYYSAKKLQKAFKNGEVGEYSRFTWTMSNGYVSIADQINYYEDMFPFSAETVQDIGTVETIGTAE